MRCKNPTALCPRCEKVEALAKGRDKQYRFLAHDDELGTCPGSRRTVEEAEGDLRAEESVQELFSELAEFAGGVFS